MKLRLVTIWVFALLAAGVVPLAAEIPTQPMLKPPPCKAVSAVRQATLLPPKRISIMGDRYEALGQAAVGWEKTGVPLVGFDGQNFVAAGCGDDIGIYLVIPLFARVAKIPLANAIDLFLVGIVLVSALVGASGLMLVCRTRFGRIVAIGSSAVVSLLALRTGDVYPIQSSVVLAFVPWVLFFGRKTVSIWSTLPFTLFVSAALGSANLMRSHAGTPVLILAAWIFIFQSQRKRKSQLLLIVAALIGLLLPICYVRTLLHTRDVYLQNHGYGSVTVLPHHVFWHVVYVGLGFINNDVVPGYRDEIAAAKVREIAPQTIYTSPEYEKYLKHEVINIVAQHPLLVLETLAAKLGVIAGWLLLCINVGVIAAYQYPKYWAIEVGFWNAIAFEALTGVVAIPLRAYLLGFIAFAVLYGVISIDVALQRNAAQDLSRLARLRWAGIRGIRHDRLWRKPDSLTSPRQY